MENIICCDAAVLLRFLHFYRIIIGSIDDRTVLSHNAHDTRPWYDMRVFEWIENNLKSKLRC